MKSDEEVAIIPTHAAYRDDLAVFISRRVQVCRVRHDTPRCVVRLGPVRKDNGDARRWGKREVAGPRKDAKAPKRRFCFMDGELRRAGFRAAFTRSIERKHDLIYI